MKTLVTMLLLCPMIAGAQPPAGSVHDLSDLPTLRHTPDVLGHSIAHGRQHGFAVEMEAIEHGASAIRINLTVGRTNELADLSDVYVYVNYRQDAFWVPVSAIRKTRAEFVYRLNLPRTLAERSFIVLACGRDPSRQLRDEDFWVSFRQLYRTTYTIDIKSYCPPGTKRPDKRATPDITKELNIDVTIE